ncbi:hypothetical protein ABKN59_001378 [Abortiporus biennis]
MSLKSTLPFSNGANARCGNVNVRNLIIITTIGIVASTYLCVSTLYSPRSPYAHLQHVPRNAPSILAKCASLNAVPSPPPNFHSRDSSDRYDPLLGAQSTLIRNATIWTGGDLGREVIHGGDILLDKGVVRSIGKDIDEKLLKTLKANDNLVELNVEGAWVMPGIVDLHSHLGVHPSPHLLGAMDGNSPHGPIVPWLRSIDGLNTHDEALKLAVAGGVTTAQVLPGSANAIGGQAFIIKLRPTTERSPTAMIVEPPHTLSNDSTSDTSQPLRWRHLKQACGENISRRYGTRMDVIWAFREAYDTARKLKVAQDDYCAKVEAGLWDDIKGETFPEELKWEVLVDVLRGRVRISNHCYEEVDLDDLVRISNEFKFHIASFHHAAEAWLVPEVLKRMHGGPPAIAIFANNHRKKREAFRGSEFAPRVLANNGIPVVMKSDHPVLNSRYLLYEAQQAHFFSLSPDLALSSIFTTPAKAAGIDHRVGYLRKGYDADVVVWDMNPLRFGARPRQVWIDGIPQLGGNLSLVSASKSLVGQDKGLRSIPKVPNWDKEREDAVKYEGLPPLAPKTITQNKVIIRSVKEAWIPGWMDVKYESEKTLGVVVFENGKVSCAGTELACLPPGSSSAAEEIDLRGGFIGPPLFSFGSPLGLEDILLEDSTGPGTSFNPYHADLPKVLGDESNTGILKSVDSLRFGTRNGLKAHLGGVTLASTSSLPGSIFTITSVFRTGAKHALDPNAIVQEAAAIHVIIERPSRSSSISVSAQIAALRKLLLQSSEGEEAEVFSRVAQGEIPIIFEVNNADIIAALIRLKKAVELKTSKQLRVVLVGASEAHLLASEIAQENIGVILNPAKSYPNEWDDARFLPGPPITNTSSVVELVKAGVTVGLGVQGGNEAWLSRFDATWAFVDSDEYLTKRQAYQMVSTNLEKLLGIEINDSERDLILVRGGDIFDAESRVVGVSIGVKGVVELF